MAKACGLGSENGVASVAATTVRCAAKGHRPQKTEPSDTSGRKELSLSRPAAPVPKAKQNFIVLEALSVRRFVCRHGDPSNAKRKRGLGSPSSVHPFRYSRRRYCPA